MTLMSFVILLALNCIRSSGQTISPSLPAKINVAEKYLFYLHGGVVTQKGDKGTTASMPQWGPYEYLNILDSLRSHNLNIISENRRPGIDDSVYVGKLSRQVDSLIENKVPVRQIMIVGASAGAAITLGVAERLKNRQMKYVIMGACWRDTYKTYSNVELLGNYLSIIEQTDPHGSCSGIFSTRAEISSFKEIKLNTGLSHGFLFKGHKDWIEPVIEWFNLLSTHQ